MKRAVFFDRDGVINEAIVRDGLPYPPESMTQFEFVEKIQDTLKELKKRGYLLIIFTNQPDIARGKISGEIVAEFHSYILSNLDIERIYVCSHDTAANCNCRKPKAGMLLEASKDFDIDLENSYVIGDRWRDIDAGNAACCETIFIDRSYKETLKSKPNFIVNETFEITDIILSI